MFNRKFIQDLTAVLAMENIPSFNEDALISTDVDKERIISENH